MISAVATEIDGAAVMIDATDAQPLSVGGAATALSDGGSVVVGNGIVEREGDTYTVTHPGSDGVVNEGDTQIIVQVRDDRVDLLQEYRVLARLEQLVALVQLQHRDAVGTPKAARKWGAVQCAHLRGDANGADRRAGSGV